MTSISSSFISYNTNTLRGNTGPTGASGPTGDQDGAQGNAGGTQAGNTGENGIYVKSLNISSSTNSLGCTLNYILGYLTDTSTTSGEISGAEIFRGSLLLSYEGVSYQSSTLGVNICKGLSFDDSGVTKQAIFNFKDILSSSVAISVTSDSDFIYINATGGQSTYSSTNNGLAYKDTANVTTTNPNTIGLGFSFDSNFGITSGHYLYINGLTGSTNSIIVDRKKIVISKNLTDLTYLNLSNRGVVFDIKTPIGFAGFTGIAGISGATGTILSATLIFDSEDVWHFPQNIFFRNKQNYLTPGTTIIGVHSLDYGATWRADIFGRGYLSQKEFDKPTLPGNPQFNRWPINIMGAMRRGQPTIDDPSAISCTDYSKFFFRNSFDLDFKPLQLCTSGLTYCCIKGKQQLVPEHLCKKYKGRMFSSNTVKCFDPCGTNIAGTTGSCSISGICNKRYTFSECQNQNGVFTEGGTCAPPGLVPSTSGPLGACCTVNLPENCSYISQPECIGKGGVFTSGVSCADVNCSTITNFNPTINTQDIPDITENSVTKNIRLDLGGGNFDCITIIGTPEYLSQFKEC